MMINSTAPDAISRNEIPEGIRGGEDITVELENGALLPVSGLHDAFANQIYMHLNSGAPLKDRSAVMRKLRSMSN